jgi:Phosphoribosyl transferase domain
MPSPKPFSSSNTKRSSAWAPGSQLASPKWFSSLPKTGRSTSSFPSRFTSAAGERGYNQAELIARPLASRLKLKFAPRMLASVKSCPPQLLLTRAEHWESVRGAYAITPGAKVDNLRILLVDDVLTAGATLDARSRALKSAGAASVLGLTVARAGSAQPGRLRTCRRPGSIWRGSKPGGISWHLKSCCDARRRDGEPSQGWRLTPQT